MCIWGVGKPQPDIFQARPDAKYLSELEDPNVLSWDFLLTVSVSPSHTSRSGLVFFELALSMDLPTIKSQND